MKLSVLIPTFDYDARRLVADLHALAVREGVEAEILVGDDASPSGAAWLTAVESLPSVRVLRYSANAGRAAHRNRMAAEARGQWLLFIDCDAEVPPSFSLQAYVEAAREAAVVCGGLLTPVVNPCPEATLRYAYERAADRHRSARERSRHPHRQLSAFNLLVQRDLFLSVRFDEQCRDYGYEDALFGADLERRHIPILHIDNPLLHMGLEPNAVFLAKTETALRTLRGLQGRMDAYSGVATAAQRLQRCHLTWAMRLFYKLFHRPIRRDLLGPRPCLTIFKLYKLGYYLTTY